MSLITIIFYVLCYPHKSGGDSIIDDITVHTNIWGAESTNHECLPLKLAANKSVLRQKISKTGRWKKLLENFHSEINILDLPLYTLITMDSSFVYLSK